MSSLPSEIKTLHFDLSSGDPGRQYALRVGHRDYTLRRHSPATLDEAARTNRALAILPPAVRSGRVTHYASDVELPATSPALLRVIEAAGPEAGGLPALVLASVHIPAAARAPRVGPAATPHPKLTWLGVPAPAGGDGGPIIDVDDIQTAFDAAYAVVFHHPELLNLGTTYAGAIMAHIQNAPGISDLAQSIYLQATAHAKSPQDTPNWAVASPMVDQDDRPVTGPDGRQVTRYDLSDETVEAASSPIAYALAVTKDDPELQGICWTVRPSPPCARPGCCPPLGTGSPLSPRDGLAPSDATFPDGGTWQTGVTNTYSRSVAAYAQFRDPSGSPIAPAGWTSRLPGSLGASYETPTRKFLGVVPASNAIYGLRSSPAATLLSSPMPAGAVGAELLCGGLGNWTWDPTTTAAGLMLTAVFAQAIPTACLLAGADLAAADLAAMEQSAFSAVLTAGAFLTQGALATAGNPQPALRALQAGLGPILLGQGLATLRAALDAKLGQGMTLEAAPIFGWMPQLLLLTAAPAVLSATTVDVLDANAVVAFDIAFPITASVTVEPDPMHGDWPALAAQYTLVATLCDQAVTKGGPMPAPGASLVIPIPGIPRGASIQLQITLAAADGTPVGSGTLDWTPAAPAMSLTVAESLVPITAATRYSHAEKLIYNARDGRHEWSSGPAPTATSKDLDSSPIGSNLARLVGITFSQLTGTLGYAWQASGQGVPDCGSGGPADSGQVFTFQDVSVHSQAAPALQFLGCGFTQQACLVYDLLGPRSGTGPNFYLDPRGGGYYLRAVVLDGTTPFSTAAGQSFGRFNGQMDSLAVHPAGYVVGISTANHRLEILAPSSAPVPDGRAPVAILRGGLGSRPGLLHAPVAVGTAADGRILILEQAFTSSVMDAPARIQALDVFGNPVNCYAGGTSSQVALHAEAAPVTYLDLGVESQGLLYVLKVVGDQTVPGNYMLDIYQPDGTFLVQTAGVAAGKLVVSRWRDVYTLNFEVIQGSNRTEPSVSRWTPSIASK